MTRPFRDLVVNGRTKLKWTNTMRVPELDSTCSGQYQMTDCYEHGTQYCAAGNSGTSDQLRDYNFSVTVLHDILMAIQLKV